MKKENLVEVKMGDIHIKRGQPQDAADLIQKQELDEAHREAARRIAARLLEEGIFDTSIEQEGDRPPSPRPS